MSKRISFLVLAVTALVLSRVIFMFIDDPEGPNLLVVFVGAFIIALPSLVLFVPGGARFQNIIPASFSATQRFLLGILIQVFTAGVVLFIIR
jgi:hypothetical protein